MLEVDIELKNYRCFSDTSPARFRIRDGFTAFVGPNNAGKSTALRFFYEFRQLFSVLAETNVGQNQGMEAKNLWGGSKSAFNSFPPPVRDPSEVFHNKNDRPISVSIQVPRRAEGLVERIELQFERPKTGGSPFYSLRAWVTCHAEAEPLQLSALAAIESGKLRRQEGEQPIIADMSPIASVAQQLLNSIYIGPFRNAVHSGTNASYYDLQIGQAFIEAWRQFKTGQNVSQNLAALRLTEEIKATFGFNSLEINPAASGETLQLFVDGESYTLAELGAGLAQFVILLAFVATRRPWLVLIDEPELNLHPLLQQDLLLSLRNYSTGPVLFGTHVLGLARAVAEDIYVCQKVGTASKMAPLSGHPRLAELLGELSFNGYQELGFTKLLLVEGPNDVTAIRELLRLYHKDHSVVLVPLGGASMINKGVEEQLHEIKRITADITALVDSEKDSESASLPHNVAGFVEACKAASVACKVLDRRALEHYLPEHAIQKVKDAGYRALAPFEDFKTVSPRWGKVENAAIAREMTKADLVGTDLGAFLEAL